MQRRWFIEQSREHEWDEQEVQKTAQEMYDRIFNLKFTPPGRGLWAMGSPITEERGLYAALNNCGFVSTEEINSDPAKPFEFLMDAAMLGVGVGFDTKGAGKIRVQGPDTSLRPVTYRIPDSREGWVESLGKLLDSYFKRTAPIEFDYSDVRAAGLPIKGFGGTTSGPDPLRSLHTEVRKTLDKEVGSDLSVTTIVDVMNRIGQCVVSGNVRRTAEIAFGDPTSEDFLDLKNYEKNPHRAEYGWTSNNSVFADLGMDYGSVCERVRVNGEPGFAWLENMRNYGRMNGTLDRSDHRAQGGNPCLEQTLESYELCCLVETFPANHEDFADFKKTLEFAFLYAKIVTLGLTHWSSANEVMKRNRRIGCSLSGVAQFIARRGIEQLRQWCEDGYTALHEHDKKLSKTLDVPMSVKRTSIKPSGTVSLLAGATPGLHYPESRFYIRRVRLSSRSALLSPLRAAGYQIEPAAGDPSTSVVSFPIDSGTGIRSVHEISMWEQLSLAAFLQCHWADNQVSITVTFDPEVEGPQLKHALDIFQYKLKGVSFLPRISFGAYPQMPYEGIDQDKYNDLLKQLNSPDFSNAGHHPATPEVFCDTNACDLPSSRKHSDATDGSCDGKS